MKNISSAANPFIKELRSLKSRKEREERKLFFVEGGRIVEDAVKSGADIVWVVVSDGFLEFKQDEFSLELLKRFDDKVISVPDSLFATISDTENPQGILAVITQNEKTTSEISDYGGIFVFLDEIRDPGNLGTIIRTADAAGFSGVILSRNCVDVFNPKSLRATMGSVFHIPVYSCGSKESLDVLRVLKTKGLRIVGSSLSASLSIHDADLKEKFVLIVGSEAAGIGTDIEKEADMLVKIKMPGRAESLNASVAAGIMMFEVARQRS